MPNPYISRTFIFPSQFSFLPANTDVYTDAQIDNLYLRFSACYANRVYNIAKNSKMGCKAEMDCESKYLLMALYILRNWYNPNPYSFAQFSLQNILGSGTNNVNLYIVPSNGSQLNTSQLDNASGYSQAQVAFNDLITNAPLYLLGQKGWTLQFTGPNSFLLTAPVGYTGNNWIWINEINNGGTTTVVNQWVEIQSINPCLSTATIQNIIGTCIEICGQCNNKQTLLTDNNFIPLGQTFIPPSDLLTNIFPNTYFE